jgi:preprotein translocase subunit SecG
MAYVFIRTLHIIACLLMIIVVLLQTGRGAGLSVFGGSGDSLITTPTGSSFMKNLTTGLACLFAFTSLFLTLLSARSGMSSVTNRAPLAPPPVSAPEAPPAPAPAGAPAPGPSK